MKAQARASKELTEERPGSSHHHRFTRTHLPTSRAARTADQEISFVTLMMGNRSSGYGNLLTAEPEYGNQSSSDIVEKTGGDWFSRNPTGYHLG